MILHIPDMITTRLHKLMQQMLALVLCFCMLLPFAVPSAKAAEEGQAVENTYLLRVNTGVNSGANVRYIGVTYLDDRDILRTELLFPHNGALEESYRIAQAVSAPDDRLNTVQMVTNYIPDSYTSTLSTINGLDIIGTTYRQGAKSKVASYGTGKDGLTADSNDEYLFQTHYPMKELASIDIYQQYSSNMKGWRCESIELFQVDTLYGLNMFGYYSNEFYVDFSGSLIWSTGAAMDFTVSGGDRVTHLYTDKKYVYEDENGNPVGGLYYLKSQNQSYTTHDKLEYLFEIDIADVFGAGVETFATEYGCGGTMDQLGILEFLTLRITYQDVTDHTRSVDLPVVTSAFAWALEHRKIGRDNRFIGLAQQGENLIFAGNLPGFVSLKGCSLLYDGSAAAVAGVALANKTVNRGGTFYYDMDEQETEDGLLSDLFAELRNDPISLTGLRIYRFSGDSSEAVSYTGCGSDMRFQVEGKPILFYSTSTTRGETLSNSSVPREFKLEPYSDGARLSPDEDLTGRYVVEMTVDSVAAASTTSDVNVVFNYLSTDGMNRTTRPVILRAAVQDFYGAWPGSEEDYAYSYATAPGSELHFFLDVADLAQFTGVTLSMSSRDTDDFQVKSITIYSPNEIGQRKVEWTPHATEQNATDRIFSRDFDTSFVAMKYGDEKKKEYPLYVDGSSGETESIHVDFNPGSGGGGGSGGDEEETKKEIDWSKLLYTMSYKEAKQDFGFTKPRVSYEVEVKVASNDSATATNGDCGSNNLFYFQLIFENGSSSFVLANQQLTADGFRAGQLETFTIQTNQDYGEVTAVRVVPDDTSTTKNGDIFDKLNIDYISVTRKSAGSTSRSWIAENVGWIEIDYRDPGAQDSQQGVAGRSAEQIARDFLITNKGYTVNILFAMATGTYGADLNDVTGEKLINDYPQMEGSLTATIYYYNSDLRLQEKNIDLVNAMYVYNGKKPVYSDSLSFVDSDDSEVRCSMIDKSRMLRGDHVDRFFVSLLDVSELVSIEIKARGTVSTYWQLNSLNAFMVNSDGSLRLNAQDEYQRHYADELEPLASIAEENVRLRITDDGVEQTKFFNFTHNTIEIKQEGQEWVSVITREPTSDNDTLNVYVHPYENGTGLSMQKYDMFASLSYHDKLERSMELKIRPMNKDSEDHLFYATGLSVPGLDSLYSMSLSANSEHSTPVYIDYAVIQHLRSGVVIDTYFMDFRQANAQNTIHAVPSEGTEQLLRETQSVQLYFGEGTSSSTLSAEKNDLVVALRYTSTNDVNRGSSAIEYVTPYIYLTDLKDENGKSVYQELKPGMVAVLDFHVPFVREITGITLATVGSVNAVVDSAIADQYPTASTDPGSHVWYYFSSSERVSRVPHAMLPTQTNVVPVEVALKTAPSQEGISSGVGGPIRMTISYLTQSGNLVKTRTVEDIRDYLQSGGFDAGQTAILSFFMKDVGAIRSLTLEPYSSDLYQNAVWDLDTVTVRTITDGETHTLERKLNSSTIMEGQPRQINLSNIVISTSVSYFNSKVEEFNGINSDINGEVKALIYSGDSVTIRVKLSGSMEDYGYTVSAVLERNEATTAVSCFEMTGNDTIEFTPPANTSGADNVYKIYIASEESPDTRSVIEVRVESEPVVNPQPESEKTPDDSGGSRDPGETEPENEEETDPGTPMPPPSPEPEPVPEPENEEETDPGTPMPPPSPEPEPVPEPENEEETDPGTPMPPPSPEPEPVPEPEET